MILKEAYNLGVKLLKLKNCNTKLEVRLILQHILLLNDINFLIQQNYVLNSSQIQKLYELITLRNTGYPMAYILGYKAFWKNNFIVNSDVLIPRPETETLVAAVLNIYHSQQSKQSGSVINILDIGVGSGCILLSLLQEITNSVGTGVDISQQALVVCKKNIDKLKIAHSRVKLIKSNVFSSLNNNNKFDIIVSNPPYIDVSDNLIDSNVKKFEPPKSLFAKNGGLKVYNDIFKQINHYLNKDGKLFLEIGIHQKEQVVNLNKNRGLIFTQSFKDDLNIDRVLLFINKL